MYVGYTILGLGIFCLVANICLTSLYSTSSMTKHRSLSLSSFPSSNYQLAYIQSNGFFDDIDETNWKRLQGRVTKQQFPNHHHSVGKKNQTANKWYQNNFEPNFNCLHERRIGGFGDGGKWVCDPFRISKKADAAAIHNVWSNEEIGGGCLVYSVGSAGRFHFERGVKEDISTNCEIHTFDLDDYSTTAEPYSTFHHWGIGTEEQAILEPDKYKTLEQTIQILNHINRTIDIFKIDCEKCEWSVYKDWLTIFANNNNNNNNDNIQQSSYPYSAKPIVEMKQILVETHSSRLPVARDFFYELHNHGYVIFHKEPNIIGNNGGKIIEYAFLKLNIDFLGDTAFYSIS